MFTFIFSISLISSTVYQTPGYVPVQEPTPSDVLIPEEILTDVQEDSTKEISTFWIFMIIITFMVLVFLVFKKRVFKKRKKIENYSQQKKDDDFSRGNHLETRSKAEADNLARDMSVDVDNHADTSSSIEKEKIEKEKIEKETKEKEFDEFIDELGLNEVKDKTKEVKEDEY